MSALVVASVYWRIPHHQKENGHLVLLGNIQHFRSYFKHSISRLCYFNAFCGIHSHQLQRLSGLDKENSERELRLVKRKKLILIPNFFSFYFIGDHGSNNAERKNSEDHDQEVPVSILIPSVSGSSILTPI